MKISIKWKKGKASGEATVVEACCQFIPKGTNFNVWSESDLGNKTTSIGLHSGWEDAYATPFHFCPSCGREVYIIQEEESPPLRYTCPASGDTKTFKGESI